MANTNLGTAWIQIKPSTKGMTAAIRNELSGVGDSEGQSFGKSFSGGFAAKMGAVAGVASNIFGKITSTVMGSFNNAIARADTLNNFSNVMSNLNISQEESQQSIDKLSERLSGLPTSLDAAAGAVQRFTTANGDIGKSTDMFLALNDALLAGGAGAEIQSTALEQISQAYAKGKPDMVEWKSVLNAMPAQAKQLADALGYVSTDALGEALRNGELSMDDFMAKVVELDTTGVNGFKSFQEQARVSLDTIDTKMQNVQTSVTKVITSALNGEDMTKPIQQLTERVNELAPVLIQGFVGGFVGVAKAIPGMIPPIIQALVDQLPQFITGTVDLLIGLAEQLPQIIMVIVNALPNVINSLVTALTSPDNMMRMLQAGLQLWMAIVEAIPQIIIALINAMPQIITNLVDYLTRPDTIIMVISAAIQMFMGIVQAVPQIIGSLLSAFGNLFSGLWNTLTTNFGAFAARFGDFLGGTFRSAINGVLSFIENMINGPIDLINNFVDTINSALGAIGVNIGHVPRVYLPRLATGGIVQGTGTEFSDSNLYALSRGEFVLRAAAARQIGYEKLEQMNKTGEISAGNVTIINNINGYNKDPQELANIISRKIAFNQRGVIG